MLRIVLDGSTLVGAVLKLGSTPERALLLARAHGTICLSQAVEAEIREVFARPKFRRYLIEKRARAILALLTATAEWVNRNVIVSDCRDSKDNKYLELALCGTADILVASDDDLLCLDPWRGISILSPTAFVNGFIQ